MTCHKRRQKKRKTKKTHPKECLVTGKVPEEIVTALLQMHAKVDSEGTQDGNWVSHAPLVKVFKMLSDVVPGLKVYSIFWTPTTKSITFPLEHIDTITSSVALQVSHMTGPDAGYHFSSFYIDEDSHVIHSFDTISSWTPELVMTCLEKAIPNVDFCAYKSQCHQVLQVSGSGTCGPSSVWSCFAYGMNYQDCRLRDLVFSDIDALKFWRAVTV